MDARSPTVGQTDTVTPPAHSLTLLRFADHPIGNPPKVKITIVILPW